MTYTTTISQKGQIVVPKPIRDSFGIKPFQTIIIKEEGDYFSAKPAISVDTAFGMFKAKKVITEKDIKDAHRAHMEKKFSK
ncbi:MAG: AbrB/MazE/SpoVT family DNA-binding domain-containing protein [bacterium]